MNETFNLYRLQQLDTQRLQRLKRIKRIDQIIASDKAVQKIQKRIDLALRQHTEKEAILADLNTKVSEKTLKYKQTQAKLFGGKISVTKELQDLQAESEALTRTIQTLEDKQLDAIHESEITQAALDDAHLAMKQLLNEQATDNSLLLGERERLLQQLPKINSQREALKNQIEDGLFEEYSALFKAKGGIAVAEVIEGSCRACSFELSPTDLQQAANPGVILKCKGCGRILYKA